MNPATRRIAVLAAACVLPVIAFASPASAHPLGNATVSHYNGLTLAADHVDDYAVEDTAEIPTVARESRIDTSGDGSLSGAERAAYAASQCASLANGVHLTVGGEPFAWQVVTSDYAQRPGAAALPIGRLVCQLRARVSLTAPSTVALHDAWDGAGTGWHEITAVGDGVVLTNSPVPATSVSAQLLAYPNDLLSSPLNVRAVTLQVAPGVAPSTYTATKGAGSANWAVRAVSRLSTTLNNMVAGKLTLGIGILAVLLAMVLGAGHAMLPGHGKTIMAAYLIGKRGRLRDVVTVGATVTITHTAGVLILGTLITLSATFAPTAVEQGLGVVSGLIVVGVGVGLLTAALRRRRVTPVDAARVLLAEGEGEDNHNTSPVVVEITSRADGGGGTTATLLATVEHAHGPRPHMHPHPHVHEGAHPHPHPHPHSHDHAHGDAHGDSVAATHEHGWLGAAHDHGPGGHSHDPQQGFSRKGLIGLGAAGGLVPSPSALLVLLATIALGRTAFGVLLVLAYGLGMAGALTIAGLLLVKFRNRLATLGAGRFRRLTRIAAVLPILTATLVIVVGIGLAIRSFGGNV